MVIPLLDAIAIQGKTITVDALLTQRKFADYVFEREADYHFTVKNNQPTLRQDIALFFESRQEPDYIDHTPPPITDASKPEKYGQPRRLTVTWISLTSDKPS